jgi:hemerythrin-like domain-containing protein
LTFANRISATLHDEHGATVALMERLETLLNRHRRGNRPDASDPAVARLLRDLCSSVDTEIERHFTFEEDSLFTYLDAIGDKDIGAHLTDEHRAIRPLGSRLVALARSASASGFDDVGWSDFRQVSQELCERLLAHVQKEEMALLPLLEETMDPETEARLYSEYVENG